MKTVPAACFLRAQSPETVPVAFVFEDTFRLTVRFVFFCGRKTRRLVRIARTPGARLLLAALQVLPQRLRQPFGPKLRRTLTIVPSGIMSPFSLRTSSRSMSSGVERAEGIACTRTW